MEQSEDLLSPEVFAKGTKCIGFVMGSFYGTSEEGTQTMKLTLSNFSCGRNLNK